MRKKKEKERKKEKKRNKCSASETTKQQHAAESVSEKAGVMFTATAGCESCKTMFTAIQDHTYSFAWGDLSVSDSVEEEKINMFHSHHSTPVKDLKSRYAHLKATKHQRN